MGMMTAASDADYASEMLQDLEEPELDDENDGGRCIGCGLPHHACVCYDDDDANDEREHVAHEE